MSCSRLVALAVLMVLMGPFASPAAANTGGDAARCLALAMYWEAKSEGPDGMLAVGQVVLNRVSHPEFPDTICAGWFGKAASSHPVSFPGGATARATGQPRPTPGPTRPGSRTGSYAIHPPTAPVARFSFTTPRSTRPGRASARAPCKSAGTCSTADPPLPPKRRSCASFARSTRVSSWCRTTYLLRAHRETDHGPVGRPNYHRHRRPGHAAGCG